MSTEKEKIINLENQIQDLEEQNYRLRTKSSIISSMLFGFAEKVADENPDLASEGVKGACVKTIPLLKANDKYTAEGYLLTYSKHIYYSTQSSLWKLCLEQKKQFSVGD